jgi:hypothetical protein
MLALYLPYFYMWDPVLNPLWTMEHTYKRGFFRFVPGLVAAFVASPPVLTLLRRCDGTAQAGTGTGVTGERGGRAPARGPHARRPRA